MKDFHTTASLSNKKTVAMCSQPDQETAALQQPDTHPVCRKENGETDLFANAIRLPSESSAARTILKSSAWRASGQLVIGTNPGRLIQIDSELEYKVALILSVKPDLADLREQVCFKWFDQTGKSHSHFFDFVITCKSGERTAVIVKEASRLRSERLRREIKMIGAQAVPNFADRVIVVTQRDINAIDLHNAKLLHDVRHPDLEADEAAVAVTNGLVGAATIADLSAMMEMGGRGFRALARLIRRQALVLLHHEVVSHGSFVRRVI
ncbi:hypothetical protein [Phaeovulum sp.]|uniref:hypothetical protein n=1 Tax=Phaeovulum sp. TaxID=2934796 RepID=UPI0039E3AACD